jgi:ABC-2 type transport system ATP-binding protein
METTGITDVSNRMIRNLSKGYRQRVGFAQAILGYPEIIILDEPTVGLDPKQIIEIRELIKKLGEKHTVILSSHILTEISAVCDHVFIISKGKLVASDSTENLVSLMSGAQEIELVVKHSGAEAKELLENVEEIERVELLGESEEQTELRIYAAKGADVREQVFAQMAQNQIPVLEMHTVIKSLEDVFLEITQEGEQK